MNILKVKDWDTLSKKLQHNFQHLTENDLKFERGHEEKMIKRLVKRLGNKQEEVVEILFRI